MKNMNEVILDNMMWKRELMDLNVHFRHTVTDDESDEHQPSLLDSLIFGRTKNVETEVETHDKR